MSGRGPVGAQPGRGLAALTGVHVVGVGPVQRTQERHAGQATEVAPGRGSCRRVRRVGRSGHDAAPERRRHHRARRGAPDDAVVVEHLRVVRGGRDVLPDLSVTVPRGQVVGLLGPSGGGKSTLMRAVVGVQVVESGTVTVLGEPAGSPALRRRVAYVTQAPSVYGDLSVRDNARYFARVLGVDVAAADRAVEAVDLVGHADARVENLSGGQRSRVSLACALVGDPEVLVLDEPTVGLDPVLRRDLWAMFRRLAEEEGRTVFVSSHVMDEAVRLRPAAPPARGRRPQRLHPPRAPRAHRRARRRAGLPRPRRRRPDAEGARTREPTAAEGRRRDPADHPRDRRAHPQAAARRPPHRRPHGRRARACCSGSSRGSTPTPRRSSTGSAPRCSGSSPSS